MYQRLLSLCAALGLIVLAACALEVQPVATKVVPTPTVSEEDKIARAENFKATYEAILQGCHASPPNDNSRRSCKTMGGRMLKITGSEITHEILIEFISERPKCVYNVTFETAPLRMEIVEEDGVVTHEGPIDEMCTGSKLWFYLPPIPLLPTPTLVTV